MPFIKASARSGETLEPIVSEYERWQDRYSGPGYAFGNEPNYFESARNYFRDLGGRWRLRMVKDAMEFGSPSKD